MTPAALLDTTAHHAQADTSAPLRPTDAVVAPGAVVVGLVAGHDAAGRPLVAFPAASPGPPVAARSVVPVAAQHVGAEVALLFEENDPARPIVMGVLQPLLERSPGAGAERPSVDVHMDGERVVFTANREIVLRCGAASITLTRAGKVVIAGEYVLTRSRGVNRIRGGSVQIN